MNESLGPKAVKNRKLKMSPDGIPTLPVSARKALRMEKGAGCRVTLAIREGTIILEPATKTGGFRVSPKGRLALQGKARALPAGGAGRHCRVELDERAGSVKLNPFA